jgi:hypothetical protein
MVDYYFKNAGGTINCHLKVDHIAPTPGANGTIMEIRDNGTTKIAQYFNKGVIYNQVSLKAIATQIGGITLTAVGEGTGASSVVI